MDLTTYDIILLNTSGGKDSQAMMIHLVRMAREQGVSDRLIAAHAILEEEWTGTLELVEKHCEMLDVPLRTMKRPQGSLLKHIEQRGKWPDNQNRYCTSDHKRGQVLKIVTSESNKLCKKHVRVLNCMGIRAAESKARSKKHPFQNDKRQSNGKRTVDIWYPLFTWTERDVWNTIRSTTIPYHFAYDLGMPRLSCCFCVFASKDALVLSAHHNPTLFEKYVEVEKKINHTFRKDVSLVEIKSLRDSGYHPEKINTWEM